MKNELIHDKCREILNSYKSGLLGQTSLPEDAQPIFLNDESRLIYFTLPMALNFRRNSYQLWKAAQATYEDEETRGVFSLKQVTCLSEDELRKHLSKYSLATQKNRHIVIWQTIVGTIEKNFNSMTDFLEASDNDFLKLQYFVQDKYKKGFPYLSGPKLFNYWAWILNMFIGKRLKNSEYINIAVDTHVKKSSIRLGVISEKDALLLTSDEIANRWREVLEGADISPSDMNVPLWFWSRNGFEYKLGK